MSVQRGLTVWCASVAGQLRLPCSHVSTHVYTHTMSTHMSVHVSNHNVEGALFGRYTPNGKWAAELWLAPRSDPPKSSADLLLFFRAPPEHADGRTARSMVEVGCKPVSSARSRWSVAGPIRGTDLARAVAGLISSTSGY